MVCTLEDNKMYVEHIERKRKERQKQTKNYLEKQMDEFVS